MHRVSWGNYTTLLTPGLFTTWNMCLVGFTFTLWCLTGTSISRSWSYPILDQKKKKKTLPPHQSENLRKWILTIAPGESNTRQGFEDRAFPRALVSNHSNRRQGQVLFYSKSSQAVNKINAGADLFLILVVQGVFCSLLELNLQWMFHNYKKKKKKAFSTHHSLVKLIYCHQAALRIIVHSCTSMKQTGVCKYKRNSWAWLKGHP